jgi:hypothetical protein
MSRPQLKRDPLGGTHHPVMHRKHWWQPIVTVLALGACSQAGPKQAPEPPPLPLSRTNVVGIGLAYRIGRWSSGASYSYEVRRDGIAKYEGGIRAPRRGSHYGRMDTSVVRSLLDQVAKPAFLDSGGRPCSDVATRTIVVILVDGSRLRFEPFCWKPDPNEGFATTLDSLFAALTWVRGSVPPN